MLNLHKPLIKFEIQVFLAVMALTVLVGIGTIVYHQIEGWSWISSFYFSVTTLTTVGYGDLHPTTEATRLFTAVYLIMGITIALASFAIIGKSYLQMIEGSISFKKHHKKEEED